MKTEKPRGKRRRSVDDYAVGDLLPVGNNITLRVVRIAEDGEADVAPATEEDRLRWELLCERAARRLFQSAVPKARLRLPFAQLKKLPEKRRRQTEAGRRKALEKRAAEKASNQARVRRLRAQGLTRSEIAEETGLTVHQVKRLPLR